MGKTDRERETLVELHLSYYPRKQHLT